MCVLCSSDRIVASLAELAAQQSKRAATRDVSLAPQPHRPASRGERRLSAQTNARIPALAADKSRRPVEGMRTECATVRGHAACTGRGVTDAVACVISDVPVDVETCGYHTRRERRLEAVLQIGLSAAAHGSCRSPPGRSLVKLGARRYDPCDPLHSPLQFRTFDPLTPSVFPWCGLLVSVADPARSRDAAFRPPDAPQGHRTRGFSGKPPPGATMVRAERLLDDVSASPPLLRHEICYSGAPRTNRSQSGAPRSTADRWYPTSGHYLAQRVS